MIIFSFNMILISFILYLLGFRSVILYFLSNMLFFFSFLPISDLGYILTFMDDFCQLLSLGCSNPALKA